MVKSKLVPASGGKTKNLKQVTSSEDSDKSSEESEVLKSKSKKIPSIKSKSRHQVSDSSSEEPKKKQKDKKKSKKRYESESESSEEVLKKKKKYQDSSDESEDLKKKSKKNKKSKVEVKKISKKKKDSSSSEEVKKSKKKAHVSESESEEKVIKSKKGKKLVVDSESESEKVSKKKSKGKKAESSDEEPQKKTQKPAAKATVQKKKLDSSSEEADPYDSKAVKSVQKPSAVAKVVKDASSSSSPSSPNSVHSSDAEEQNLVLTKGKASQKSKPTETLPFKRPAADPVVKVKSAEPSVQQPAPQSENLQQFSGTDIELFVGGLAYEAGEEDLRQLFSKYGEIERISIPHRDGSPSGIAFISFTSPQSAQNALVLNNTQFMNRNLRISFSSGKKSKPAGPAGGFNSARPASGGSSTVFVGNIPYTANEDLLQDFFSQCGDIKQVRLAKLPTGELKGFAHVEFYELDSANKAVALAGQPIEGRAIKVELSAPKSAPGPRGGDMGSRPARPVNQSFAGQKIRL